MNKTKIEWCDMTWNPVTGCQHGCEYCYARKIAQRFGGHAETGERHVIVSREGAAHKAVPFPFGFDPTFYHYRLKDPQTIKKPQTIFVCSMADLFGEWVPDEWIERVFQACYQASQHQYLFLTKNPDRYADAVEYLEERIPDYAGDAPPGMWLGATATNNVQLSEAYDSAATWLSIEPILEKIETDECFTAYRRGDDAEIPRWLWVVIGAETGSRKDKVIPKRSWIEEVVKECDANGIPVFMKDSLIPIVGEAAMRREFPWDAEWRQDDE